MLRSSLPSISLVTLLVASAVIGCADDDANPPPTSAGDELELDTSSPEALEGDLVGLEGKEDSLLHVFYTSGYVNMTLVGQDASGEPVVLIVGDHTRDYPYFHEDSEWDNILLWAGGRELRLTESSIDSLTLTGLDDGSDKATVTFEGDMFDEGGERASVSVALTLEPRPTTPKFLGVGALGLRWAPAWLEVPDGSIALDGQDIALSHLRGFVEVGTLKNLKDPKFAVQYDALFLIPASADVESYCYVDISTRTLPGKLSGVLDPLLSEKARVSSTWSPDGEREGNRFGVSLLSPSDPRPVIFEDVADSGLAFVHRQVVLFEDADGNKVYGLRDVFDPR